MAKSRNDYFKLLEEKADNLANVADLLENLICNFNNIKLEIEKDRIHKIEHQTDKLHYEILNKLSSEFITIIEQEDILHLVQLIDNITDALYEVVKDYYMYSVDKTPPNAYQLVKIVNRCIKSLKASIYDLRNFKKSEKLYELLIDVLSIESEANTVYIDAIHNLFTSNLEYKMLIGYKEIYESLENCCNLCAYAAEIIEQIVIKNI